MFNFKTKNRKVYGLRKYLCNVGFKEEDHEEICDIFLFTELGIQNSTWHAKGKVVQENFEKFTNWIKTSKYVETTFERSPIKIKK